MRVALAFILGVLSVLAWQMSLETPIASLSRKAWDATVDKEGFAGWVGRKEHPDCPAMTVEVHITEKEVKFFPKCGGKKCLTTTGPIINTLPTVSTET